MYTNSSKLFLYARHSLYKNVMKTTRMSTWFCNLVLSNCKSGLQILISTDIDTINSPHIPRDGLNDEDVLSTDRLFHIHSGL